MNFSSEDPFDPKVAKEVSTTQVNKSRAVQFASEKPKPVEKNLDPLKPAIKASDA